MSISDMCLSLLSETTETSGLQLAASILDRYRHLDEKGRTAFFAFLNDDLDINPQAMADLATQYKTNPSPELFRNLSEVSESRRLELFRRLNQAPGATAELVKVRENLLRSLRDNPSFARTDHDLVHLLRSWFNRGFLVLRQISWDTSASILEKIIAYEAVHEIQNWDDLRRRLQPEDRRCFAFFHPSMPDEPLIFVQVALTKGGADSIQEILSDSRQELAATDADTAVFYSISNCQNGLASISFGNSLIKQVVQDLSYEAPRLNRFITLSPIPRLSMWLEREGLANLATDQSELKQLAAHYLLEAKTPGGRPFDPVARFHLGNGARIDRIHVGADLSRKGLTQSRGAMVNYLYDLPNISQNAEKFSKNGDVATTALVRSLARRGARRQ